MIKTLLHSLRAGDWGMALDFLSPSFFQVVPTLGMTRIIGQLSRNALNHSLYKDVLVQWEPFLVQRNDSDPHSRGQHLLGLYFAAILSPDFCFLDLRSERFALGPNGWEWQPKAWMHRWSPEFQAALIGIYQGFYEGDPELFRRSLSKLQLDHAEELFLDIFGKVREEPLLFSLDQFRSSFHKVFLSCREHKTQLHPEFLPLGLLLFSLYEHAQSLGVLLHPKDAWQSMQARRMRA